MCLNWWRFWFLLIWIGFQVQTQTWTCSYYTCTLCPNLKISLEEAGTNLETKLHQPFQAHVKSPILLLPWPTKLASVSSSSCCLSQFLSIKCSSSHRKMDYHNLTPSCKAWSPYICRLIILGAWLWSGQVGGTGATLLGGSLWLGERCSCSRWLCWAISGSLFACEKKSFVFQKASVLVFLQVFGIFLLIFLLFCTVSTIPLWTYLPSDFDIKSSFSPAPSVWSTNLLPSSLEAFFSSFQSWSTFISGCVHSFYLACDICPCLYFRSLT